MSEQNSPARPGLSFAVVAVAGAAPILEGSASIAGANIHAVPVKSVDEASRGMLAGQFDLAEMSLATFCAARGPDSPLAGLPIFTGRRFIQGGVIRTLTSPLRSPAELAGKRVALPQYWLTSSVWHRGVLRHAFGVRPEQVKWVTSTAERMDIPFAPELDVRCMPGASIVDLLLRGEVDAAMVPRANHPLFQHPEICSVLAGADAQARRDHENGGVFPVMHLVVAKKQVLKQHPLLAAGLVEHLKETGYPAVGPAGGWAAAPRVDRLAAETLNALDTFLGYCHEQGLIAKKPSIGEFFAY
jgi:4,5-dihydroxyphthalate decarboxylase